VYRLLKHHTPGPYTFILRATTEVPRRLMQSKRRTIGLRVPENAVTQALLSDLGEPLMSVTLIMPGETLPLIDPYEIRELLEHQVDLVIDGGYCGMEATTVVDLADDEPMVLRAGKGDPTPFEAA
jgi:tRNA threonylcarbamoyl adenosine modification protein (Sua5/YciO/YrdC/YwlC family)